MHQEHTSAAVLAHQKLRWPQSGARVRAEQGPRSPWASAATAPACPHPIPSEGAPGHGPGWSPRAQRAGGHRPPLHMCFGHHLPAGPRRCQARRGLCGLSIPSRQPGPVQSSSSAPSLIPAAGEKQLWAALGRGSAGDGCSPWGAAVPGRFPCVPAPAPSLCEAPDGSTGPQGADGGGRWGALP